MPAQSMSQTGWSCTENNFRCHGEPAAAGRLNRSGKVSGCHHKNACRFAQRIFQHRPCGSTQCHARHPGQSLYNVDSRPASPTEYTIHPRRWHQWAAGRCWRQHVWWSCTDCQHAEKLNYSFDGKQCLSEWVLTITDVLFTNKPGPHVRLESFRVSIGQDNTGNSTQLWFEIDFLFSKSIFVWLDFKFDKLDVVKCEVIFHLLPYELSTTKDFVY